MSPLLGLVPRTTALTRGDRLEPILSCQWGSSRQGLQAQRLLPLVLSALLTAVDTNPLAAAAPSGLDQLLGVYQDLPNSLGSRDEHDEHLTTGITEVLRR